jgi:hypothetical protein
LATVEGDQRYPVLEADLGDQCIVDIATEVELDRSGQNGNRRSCS